VSLHFNEDSKRETAGWETYCLSPQYAPSTSSGGTLRGDERQAWPGNEFDHHNFLLTQAIHRSAVAAMTNAPSDRGLKRARFKVLRLARAPSVLVEGGFMSNPREAALMKTEAYREQVARWVLEGILAYRLSQEIPEDTARLKVAAAATNPPRPQLEAVPDFRPKTNPPAGTSAAALPANPAASSKEPEVRRAVAVEPEVRKAIPVEPRKGE
jgi:hypothetical protein